MSNLPVERLPFNHNNHTGVDYFGPLYVPVRRSTEKRYGFLFICLITRAVHLRIVPSLDISSCVMGIERFIARRGTPSTIRSDNGTNIVGAEKELLAALRAGMAWLGPFMHTKVLLENSNHQAHPIMAAPGSASSEA